MEYSAQRQQMYMTPTPHRGAPTTKGDPAFAQLSDVWLAGHGQMMMPSPQPMNAYPQAPLTPAAAVRTLLPSQLNLHNAVDSFFWCTVYAGWAVATHGQPDEPHGRAA